MYKIRVNGSTNLFYFPIGIMEEYMKKQSLALILGLLGLFFLNFPLNAATVSVVVVEAGLPPGNGCTLSAEIWESGMMDVFFEAGHIVSNAPCMQINDISGILPAEVNRDFDQARIGGADFLVLVILNYKDGSAEYSELAEYPKEVFIRLFYVSTGELLHETIIAAANWGTTDAEFIDAKQQAGKIVPRLVNKSIPRQI